MSHGISKKIRQAFTKAFAAGLAIFSAVPMVRNFMPEAEAFKTSDSKSKKTKGLENSHKINPTGGKSNKNVAAKHQYDGSIFNTIKKHPIKWTFGALTILAIVNKIVKHTKDEQKNSIITLKNKRSDSPSVTFTSLTYNLINSNISMADYVKQDNPDSDLAPEISGLVRLMNVCDCFIECLRNNVLDKKIFGLLQEFVILLKKFPEIDSKDYLALEEFGTEFTNFQVRSSEIIKELTKFQEVLKCLDSESSHEIHPSDKKWKETKSEFKDRPLELEKIATETGNKLIEDGILEKDDIRYGERASSEKFAKAFIRYLEVKFSDLKDNVELFYCPIEAKTGVFKANPTKKAKKEFSEKVEKIKEETKTNGKIYFLIYQLKINTKVGHGKLIVICNGKEYDFDTAYNEKQVVQSKHDIGNCIAMSLGVVESFLKQISKIKKDIGIEFSKELDRFFESKVQISYLGYYDIEETYLLPPKYLRYIQSKTSIDTFLEMAEKPENKNNKEIQEVAEKFKKVKKRYFSYDESGNIDDFLKSSYSKEDYDKIKPIVDSVLSDFGIDSNDLNKFKHLILKDEKVEKFNHKIGHIMWHLGNETRKEILKIVRSISESKNLSDYLTEQVERLNSLPSRTKTQITDSINELILTFTRDFTFGDAKKYFNIMELNDHKTFRLNDKFRSLNNRANMKRQTEILKIKQFLETLKESNIDPQDEINKVKILLSDD